MADRITKVEGGLSLRQREQSRDTFLAPKSVSLDLLDDEVVWGLLPLGAVIPIMPAVQGAFLPGGSGQVSNGLIVCDGAAIPSGHSVTGNTPQINNSSYLRGASSTTGISGGSNSRVLNTPQLPLHNHPLGTVATDNAPHVHVGSTGAVNTPHNHPGQGTGTMNLPHGHPVSVTTNNAPHSHTQTTGIGTYPHTHPAGSGASNAPHNHTGGTFGTALMAHDNHAQYVWANVAPGPTARRDWNDDGPSSRYRQGGLMGTNRAPHTHPATVNPGGGHAHPWSFGTANAPHTHVTSIGTGTLPHSHNIPVGTSTNRHTHTISINTANMPHNHTKPFNTNNVPHTHPATVNPTGSTSSVNFEPQYIQAVFVMRVS
jgi:hypothetical protein